MTLSFTGSKDVVLYKIKLEMFTRHCMSNVVQHFLSLPVYLLSGHVSLIMGTLTTDHKIRLSSKFTNLIRKETSHVNSVSTQVRSAK